MAAALPLAVAVVRPGITGFKLAQLEDMVHGRAERPYVKRQLVPLLVRAGVGLTPESFDARLRETFARSALVRRLGWPPAWAPEFVFALGLMYLSMLGFLVVLRRLLLACLDISPRGAHGVVWCVAAGLPVCYAGQVYLYDYSQLFLFTAALLCMLRHRWHVYYPMLALACLNKETSILLPVVFAFWKGRQVRQPAFLAHLVAQAGMGLSICGMVAWVFRHHPGGNVIWTLDYNLAAHFSALAWIRLAVLVVGIVLALWRIRAAPLFLSRGLAATLPALLVVAPFFGFIHELRAYYEALPFGVGLALLTVGWARSPGSGGARDGDAASDHSHGLLLGFPVDILR